MPAGKEAEFKVLKSLEISINFQNGRAPNSTLKTLELLYLSRFLFEPDQLYQNSLFAKIFHLKYTHAISCGLKYVTQGNILREI